MVSTRADRKMVDSISKALNELSNIGSVVGTNDERHQKRIQIVENLFNNILVTSEGQTFINKHEAIKDVIRNKLEVFYNEPGMKENTMKWHMEIFKEPIQQEQKEDENIDAQDAEDAEDAEEDYLVNTENERLCEEWIKHITKSSTLTRKRLLFLGDIWGILRDIDEAQTMYNAVSYNKELYENLITEFGQNMLKQFPLLSNLLKTEVNYQYTDGRIVEWESENWWNEVFNPDYI